jgi:hypothetical protein
MPYVEYSLTLGHDSLGVGAPVGLVVEVDVGTVDKLIFASWIR